jgi:myo-inositol-1(or 4)-monophosphatase
VYRFFTDEMYSGIVGTGAWKNEMPITTTGETNIGKAFLATGFPVKRDYSKTSLDGFVRDVQRFKKVRMLGAAAVMGSLVAEGKLDVYMEDEIMLWDIAASSAIVKAAGGCIRIEYLPEYKCICKLFANDELLENYYADSL